MRNKAAMDSKNVGNARLTGMRPAISHAPNKIRADRIFRRVARVIITMSK
jgi:hypothetical protein